MTHEEHRQRHQELYDALDELITDWMGQTDCGFDNPVSDLCGWAKLQTVAPTPNRYRTENEVHLPTIEVDRG